MPLAHDKSYMGGTNLYAYSLDDESGNFQGQGTALIIATSETKGLPNPNAATSPVYLGIVCTAIGVPVPLRRIEDMTIPGPDVPIPKRLHARVDPEPCPSGSLPTWWRIRKGRKSREP